MILLLGSTGYIGKQFATSLQERGTPFIPLSRKQHDYTNFEVLLRFLRENDISFVVNAAGYTGKPNVDACELQKSETLLGNTIFPATVANACEAVGIPWGHVSSGCIYAGAPVASPEGSGPVVVHKDLMSPGIKEIVRDEPSRIRGFTENDVPNFSFRDGPCSFYSGTKALGEEALTGNSHGYIWRLRIPFDEFDNARNYLSKIQRYSKVYDNVNSISHRADFVNGCLDCWDKKIPFGIYNVTNTGWVTTRQVVELLQSRLKLDRTFEYWEGDDEFYRVAAKTPRSNCVMDNSKLLQAGVPMRGVMEALESALANWIPEA